MFGKHMARDMLERKKKLLNTYTLKFDIAIGAMMAIVDTLTQTNSDIEQSIAEIDEYQKELEATTKELRETKDKNDTVINDLRVLIDK